MSLAWDLGDLMTNFSPNARRRRREAEAIELAALRQVARSRLALMFGLPVLDSGNDGPLGTAHGPSVAGTLPAQAIVTQPGRQPNVGGPSTPARLRRVSSARPHGDL